MKPRFLADRLGIMGLVEGRRGVDYFRGLQSKTDKKEFSFRAIESKIIRRHPRYESDSGLKGSQDNLHPHSTDLWHSFYLNNNS